MMNKEGKCATCEWFDKADGYVGQCCFLPPIPVHVPARHFHDDIGPRIDPARTDSAYPRVYADSQCGQWKAKLEACAIIASRVLGNGEIKGTPEELARIAKGGALKWMKQRNPIPDLEQCIEDALRAQAQTKEK
jgi:hypothetical protein